MFRKVAENKGSWDKLYTFKNFTRVKASSAVYPSAALALSTVGKRSRGSTCAAATITRGLGRVRCGCAARGVQMRCARPRGAAPRRGCCSAMMPRVSRHPARWRRRRRVLRSRSFSPFFRELAGFERGWWTRPDRVMRRSACGMRGWEAWHHLWKIGRRIWLGCFIDPWFRWR
jgi:hypothetical protein